MALWVPPKVSRELVEGRKQYEAQVLGLLRFEGPDLDEWNRELAKIDPHLRLGRAAERTPVGFPLVPGYYHVVRVNEGAPPTTMPLYKGDYEFAEPSSQMLDRLRSSDLQSTAVRRAREASERAAEAKREREKARDQEERREELEGRVAAAMRTQVLTSRDVPWSQNVGGKRGQGRDRKP